MTLERCQASLKNKVLELDRKQFEPRSVRLGLNIYVKISDHSDLIGDSKHEKPVFTATLTVEQFVFKAKH